jgi:hypothetical protein
MNSDGTIGPKIQTKDWSEDSWVKAEFVNMKGITYLFLLRAGGYGSHTYAINKDGTIGEAIEMRNWPTPWGTAKFFSVAEPTGEITERKTYLFLIKTILNSPFGIEKEGSVAKVYQMNIDGKLEAISQEDRQWSDAWTTVEFFCIEDITYLFLMKMVEAEKPPNLDKSLAYIYKLNTVNQKDVIVKIEFIEEEGTKPSKTLKHISEFDETLLLKSHLYDLLERSDARIRFEDGSKFTMSNLAIQNKTDTLITVWITHYEQRLSDDSQGFRLEWKSIEHSVLIAPGITKIITIDDKEIAATRVRLWATNDAGQIWDEHREKALWLVEENKLLNGLRAYFSESMRKHKHIIQ